MKSCQSTGVKKFRHGGAVDLLRSEGVEVKQGEEIFRETEEAMSAMFDESFWVYYHPLTARGFYDREDRDRPGILRDLDLIYHEGARDPEETEMHVQIDEMIICNKVLALTAVDVCNMEN